MAKTNKDDVKEDPVQAQIDFANNLKKDFEKLLSNKKIKMATIVFVLEGEEETQMYRKGHFYDSAVMLNQIMDAYRQRAAVELGL